MQSWLNWYSSGPENRHPERGSGFESHLVYLAKARKESKMTQNIPVINMVATGQRITDLRVAAGMSVRDLQDVNNISCN